MFYKSKLFEQLIYILKMAYWFREQTCNNL